MPKVTLPDGEIRDVTAGSPIGEVLSGDAICARVDGTLVDLSWPVDDDVSAAQVESVIREAGAPLLRSVTLFDLYRGAQVGEGRKSLAYALSYQHDERTLTDEEAATVRGRIVKRLHDVLGAELRAG